MENPQQFEVPKDFDLPEELITPAPRPLPEHVTSDLKHLKLFIQICLFIGALCCFGLARTMWINRLALYFLPLAYLDWIGIGLIIIQLGHLLLSRNMPHRLTLFQNGIPAPARIEKLEKRPGMTLNGMPTQYAYNAIITIRVPGSPETDVLEVQSQILPDKNSCICTYKVGDYVSALCRPMEHGVNVNLYGFLNISKTEGVIKKDEKKKTTFKEIVIVISLLLLLPGLFFIIFGCSYAYNNYSPLNFQFSLVWPAFAIGAVIGLAVMVWWLVSSRRKKRAFDAANRAAVEKGEATEYFTDFWHGSGFDKLLLIIIMGVGIPLMCSLVTYCGAITLNAWLDDSEAQVEIVDIDKLVMKTHAYMFREYVIEYHFPGDKKKRSFTTSPFHIAAFGNSKGGAVAVHSGALGWKWIKKIAPL